MSHERDPTEEEIDDHFRPREHDPARQQRNWERSVGIRPTTVLHHQDNSVPLIVRQTATHHKGRGAQEFSVPGAHDPDYDTDNEYDTEPETGSCVTVHVRIPQSLRNYFSDKRAKAGLRLKKKDAPKYNRLLARLTKTKSK